MGRTGGSAGRHRGVGGHRGEPAGPGLCPFVHAPRGWRRALLLCPPLRHLRDAGCDAVTQLLRDAAVLWDGHTVDLPVDRPLVAAGGSGRRRHTRLHHFGDWRPRTPGRRRLHLLSFQRAQLPDAGRPVHRRTGQRQRPFHHGHPRVHRGGGQVGPVPAARVASGKRAGSGAGRGADSLGRQRGLWRLPHRPNLRAVPCQPAGPGAARHRRRGLGCAGRALGAVPGQSETRDRLHHHGRTRPDGAGPRHRRVWCGRL